MSKKFSVHIEVEEGGLVVERHGEHLTESNEFAAIERFVKDVLVQTSKNVLREEQAKGFDKNPLIYVDRKVDPTYLSAKAWSVIEIAAKVVATDMLLEAYKSILDLSKVLTGQYKASNIVLHNKTIVANTYEALEAYLKTAKLKTGDRIRFVNTQPYARRLEQLGITSTRRKVRKRLKKIPGESSRVRLEAPNGTYYLTAKRVRAKYKRNASIFLDFIPGSDLGLSGTFKGHGRRNKARQRRRNSLGRPYLYPALTFRIIEGGTL